jgi:type IV pilus assembly protein PilY1
MRGRIRGVFKAIAEAPFSGTGLGSTSAQLTVGSTIFRASFTTQVWTGKLEAFDAIAAANAAKNAQPEPAPLWLASFPQWDQRNIVTSRSMNTALPFTSFNNLSASQQADLTSVDVMDYIRGRQVGLEIDNPVGNNRGWRVRKSVLGSIVSSTPRHSKAPNFSYQVGPAAGGGSSYAAYVANNLSSRRAAVFVGANDGMFHAFDGNPIAAQGGGRELFAYVPRSTYPFLKELINPEYRHRYFVDGPVVEGDVYLGGAWKTVVIGSSGAGEAGLFALDVTAPEAFSSNNVLWDITPAEEPDLGKVMGSSYIGSVKWGLNGGKWVALVPNGYQSTNNHAVLLVIDIQTGQTLRKIDTCNLNNGTPFGGAAQGGRCNATALNGLASVTPIFDSHRNIVGAYAGDYQGNLWKFDLSSGTAANWRIDTEDPNDGTGNTPIPLFTAEDQQNKPQPLTAAPRASTHPFGGSYVIIGTGKFFEYPDPTNTDEQSIYGLWVRPGDKAPIRKQDLQKFDWSESNGVRTLTNTGGFDWKTKRGWSVDLVVNNQKTGERVIADPSVERGVLTVASFQPSMTADPCTGGGTSFLYAIPMDAAIGPITGVKINGVIGAIMDIETPPPPMQLSNSLSSAETGQALQNPRFTRRGDGTYSVNAPDLTCGKMLSQINVQTGYVPQQCQGVFPIRAWRPVR